MMTHRLTRNRYDYPTLSSSLGLKLIELVPEENLTNVAKEVGYLAGNTYIDTQIHTRKDMRNILSTTRRLSEREKRLINNTHTLCTLFDLHDVAAVLLQAVFLAATNQGVSYFLQGLDVLSEGSEWSTLMSELFEHDVDTLNDTLHALFELGFIDTDDVEMLPMARIPDTVKRLLASEVITNKEQMLSAFLTLSAPSPLTLDNFTHMNTTLLSQYLQKASAQQTKGLSLLFYGQSGTGKTELARVLAKHCNKRLIEIRTDSTHNGKAKDELDYRHAGQERLRYLQLVQTLLGDNHNSILLIDECESLFEQVDERYSKERLHRFIEQSSVPSIWITNYIDWLQPSFIRRFKLVTEVSSPPKEDLLDIIHKASRGLYLSQPFKDAWVKTEHLSPALITNACHVAKTVELTGKTAQEALSDITANTLSASGLELSPPSYESELKFDTAMLNIKNQHVMHQIVHALNSLSPIRVLLTGPPGTGKTAYVHHLAEVRDIPLIAVSVSDVLSKYVGESEQQLAHLFKRAHDEQAILLFDEVDALLASRDSAQAQHEAQLVNELLMRMERNTMPVFAATNYAQKLDHAVLRRFDVKLQCNYLKPHQVHTLFKQTLGVKRLTDSESKTLASLNCLTPGDFAIIARQKRFSPDPINREQALSVLQAENNRKTTKPSIGFVASKTTH